MSKALKRGAPSLHRAIKRAWQSAGLPVPKLLLGRLVWSDLRLLGAEPTEPHVLAWISESLHRGDIFFDVGAHYGWMSVAAARAVGRSGRAVAFEPSPPLAEILSYHKRVNGLPQLSIVQKAVSNSCSARVPLVVVNDGLSYLNSLVRRSLLGDGAGSGPRPELGPGQSASTIEVDTISLDEFSLQSGLEPTVIKIDVEGAELLVLEGARNLLERCRPTVILAVHPMWLPEGQTEEQIFGLLRGLGYRVAKSELIAHQGSHCGDYLWVAESLNRRSR